MRLSLVSLGSLLALSCLTGCWFFESNSNGGTGNNGGPIDPSQNAPQTVGIDTDATITATPGDGVGVFVQYATGGHWTVSTTCDTNSSGVACNFELFVAGVDAKTLLSNPKSNDPTGRGVDVMPDGTLHLTTETSVDSNGFTFDATEGATVELTMNLDGLPQERFIYWVGDGVLHTGAPTNPVDFQPTAPPSK